MPPESVALVVGKLSLTLHDPAFTQIATYLNPLSDNAFEVILVFQGGSASTAITYTPMQVANALNASAQPQAESGQTKQPLI